MGLCLEVGVRWDELNGNGDRHRCSISMSKKAIKNEDAEEFDCTWGMWIAKTRGKEGEGNERVRERNRTHPGSVEAELKV